jgi:alkylation response protein AidB-like acyl-CoA dehydrogenase
VCRFAGSDVSGLQTTAHKTEDGKFWIVNGTKKCVGARARGGGWYGR